MKVHWKIIDEGVDGRAPQVLAIFDDAAAAIQCKEFLKGPITTVPVYVFETFEEYQSYKSGEMKRQIIDKLTLEERVCLGLLGNVEDQ